jgi:hypothetical protein
MIAYHNQYWHSTSFMRTKTVCSACPCPTRHIDRCRNSLPNEKPRKTALFLVGLVRLLLAKMGLIVQSACSSRDVGAMPPCTRHRHPPLRPFCHSAILPFAFAHSRRAEATEAWRLRRLRRRLRCRPPPNGAPAPSFRRPPSAKKGCLKRGRRRKKPFAAARRPPAPRFFRSAAPREASERRKHERKEPVSYRFYAERCFLPAAAICGPRQ